MNNLIGIVATNYSVGDFGLLTEERPIASIPYGGRYRLIDFPLSNIVNAGATLVGVITPYLYRSILDHIGNGKPWNLSRKNEGLFVLPGTVYGYDIGENKITLRDIKGNNVFLKRTNADYVVIACCNKIFNIDYNDVLEKHIKSGAGVTICYKRITDNVDKGELCIFTDDDDNLLDIKRLKKNTRNVNMCLDTMIINRDLLIKILEWYENQSYIDLFDVIKENIEHLVVSGYEFKGYVKSINNVKDFMDANKELLNQDVLSELFLQDRMIYTKIHDAHPVRYDANCEVKNAIIATGSIIKGKVINSVIFRNCVIEEGAVVKNSIIMQKSIIPKGAHVENMICDKNVRLSEGVKIIGTEQKPIIITSHQYK